MPSVTHGSAAPSDRHSIAPDRLGSAAFLQDYGVKFAYVAGAMGKGIASEELVIRLARNAILGFYGAGGLPIEHSTRAIRRIRAAVGNRPYGVNFLHNPVIPEQEDQFTDLLLAEGVRFVEASAFIRVTPALVRFRLKGLRAGVGGEPVPANRIIAKVSRPEVARRFLAPPEPAIVAALHRAGRLTDEEARLAERIPLADDLCAEADSGGHTDRRVAFTLLPHFRRLRDEHAAAVARGVRIGAAGGLGTPDAVAAAFMLGADFVLTGSINQCTPEAGTSELAKDMLAQADIADFDMAPAGDMFEIGARVQVLKRGTLFVGRANRLYELYRAHAGLHEIDPAVIREIESRILGRSLDAVWTETAGYYAHGAPEQLVDAERNPKKKMAMIFRWYFVHSSRMAIEGRADARADFQIHSGPAMGAANRWLKGTALEDWRRRHVDVLADRLMQEAADLFGARLAALTDRRTPRATGGIGP